MQNKMSYCLYHEINLYSMLRNLMLISHKYEFANLP